MSLFPAEINIEFLLRHGFMANFVRESTTVSKAPLTKGGASELLVEVHRLCNIFAENMMYADNGR